MIEVVRPGALTTVQDLGRPGWRSAGVPPGGAADPWAARAANRRVGNPDDAALLEITLAGPTLEVEGVEAIALDGDPFELRVDDERVSAGAPEALLLKGRRTRIAIGRASSGVRAWLAFAGGIDVPVVLGSRATDLAGGFGGHEGRALKPGDRLPTFPSVEREPRPLRRERVGADASPSLLRVLPGPDERLLSAAARAAVGRRAFLVGSRSDRRGVRLEGDRIEVAAHAPLRSQGILPGAVQLPPSGEPIVLGVDAPVTGGYPWIAQVIEADLGRIGRLAPGAAVRFERVDRETADRALAERERELEP